MIFYPKAKSWAAATVADRLPSPVTRITSRGTKVPAQTMRKSGEEIMRFSVLAATTASFAAIALAVSLSPKAHAESPVERGSYLVVVAGCNDCHTPGFFFGKPDKDKFLGGSDVGFEIPGLGVFNGRNITPDKETGIGAWTDEQIATAITTGKRPDGRQLAPIMNYAAFTHLTKEDVAAVVAYLRSIPPVHNQVAGPFKPGEKVSIFTFRIEPPGQTAADAPK
jgi:mono/diheme cytochrome c family protein